MRILLSGGGTAGSVVPLLAIADELKIRHQNVSYIFIGTTKGIPERLLVERLNIPITSIYGGKLRRYFDVRNISDLFLILIGFFQSMGIIAQWKPDIVIAAGGYIAVPVIWAAWILKKKILIHQQDVKPSLSNILTMLFANRITVTFPESLQYFPRSKTVATGNPVRRDVLNGKRDRGYSFFKLEPNLPTVLITGGGTGALSLNVLVGKALPFLVQFCQIIHITGAHKGVTNFKHPRYHQYDFLYQEMGDAIVVADLVISRAGMSSLTELSLAGKAVILIPLPKSHQEKNAEYFQKHHACIALSQKIISEHDLVKTVKDVLSDPSRRKMLEKNIKNILPHGGTEKVIEQILSLISI